MRKIAEWVYMAEGARIVGDVEIGKGSSVWYNAVIRGDSNPIVIGENTNIQDNAVLHVSHSHALTIGDNVTIGHGAIVHGCTIGNNVLIGMGAIVLDGVVIGDNCIIGAGALVTQNKIIPAGSLCFGNPAKVMRELTEEEKLSILENANEYADEANRLLAYDEAAVLAAKAQNKQDVKMPMPPSCPGTMECQVPQMPIPPSFPGTMERQVPQMPIPPSCPEGMVRQMPQMPQRPDDKKKVPEDHEVNYKVPSRLAQWPVQIKLMPTEAPFYENAHLLIAADCTAFAYGNFHEDFMKNKVTIIGCPKLDAVDYYEKLSAIIRNNNIKSVTVVQMTVPCCDGMENAVKRALQDSGKFMPWQAVVVSPDGKIEE